MRGPGFIFPRGSGKISNHRKLRASPGSRATQVQWRLSGQRLLLETPR